MRPRALAGLLAALAAGCGASAPVLPRPAVSLATRPASDARPVAPVDPCRGQPALSATAAPTLLACGESVQRCKGYITVEVRSCRERPLRVLRAEVTRAPRVSVLSLEFDSAVVRRGEVWTHRVPVSQAGEYSIAIELGDTSTDEPHELLVVAQVTNPQRDAELAACEACNGIWGTWGLAGFEGCNCRASDAGRLCHDGAECEGHCVFERFDVVSPGAPLRCKNGVCRGSLRTGVPVGACSERRMLFGCVSVIPRGASASPPQRLPGRAPSVCID